MLSQSNFLANGWLTTFEVFYKMAQSIFAGFHAENSPNLPLSCKVVCIQLSPSLSDGTFRKLPRGRRKKKKKKIVVR